MGKTSKEIKVNNVAAVRRAVGDIVKKGTKCVGNNMMRFVTNNGQEWKARNGVRANSLNTMELKVYGPEGVTFSSLKGFDKWINSGALLPSEQKGKKGKTVNKASKKPIVVNIDNDDEDDFNEEQGGEEDEGEEEADEEADDEDDVEEDDVAKEKEREGDPADSDEEDWENAEWGEAMSDGEGERDAIDRLGPSTPDTPGAGSDGNVASKHSSFLNSKYSRLPAANGKSASASAKRAKTRETTTSQNDTNDAWMTTISKFLTTFETHSKNEVTMQAVEEKIKYHSGELRKAEKELANLKKVTDETRKVSIEFRALAPSAQEVFSHSFLFMCPSGDTNCLCIGFEHVFHQGVIRWTPHRTFTCSLALSCLNVYTSNSLFRFRLGGQCLCRAVGND